MQVLSRKWLLIAVLTSCLPTNSEAYIHGSGAQRGQLTLNLGGAFDGGTGLEFPFRNYIKLWSPSYPDLSAIDSNNYPQSGTLATLIQGQITNLPPSQTTTGTQWVLKWTGKMGTTSTAGFSMQTSTTIISDAGSCVVGSTSINTNLGGTSCRVVFNFTTNPSGLLNLQWLSGASFDGTLSGLILCRLSDEAALDAAIAAGDSSGGFNPDFIARIKTAHYPAFLRTVNWAQVNGNNIAANADDQIPTTAVSYVAYWNTAKYAGIASGTNTYSVTVAGSPPLSDGLTVHVHFVNASSIAPTFSIDGGSTFKPMLTLFGTTQGSVAISANSNWTLVYDSLLAGWISQNSSDHSGIPLAVQVNLANTLRTGLWINIPTHATDALITSIATIVKGTLNNPAMYEYSLEVWNFNDAAFPQTDWAKARGAALAIPTSGIGVNEQVYGYYGLRVRQMAGLINAVYGGVSNCGPSTNCIVTLASQGGANTAPTNQPYRLNGQDLSPTSNSTLCIFLGGTFSGTCSGAPDYSSSPNRPVDIVDAISWADYYNGAQTQAFDGNYTSTQSSKNVTAATLANPTHLTITSHGYTTGQHITVGSFTGGWTGANIGGAVVTVLDANTISIPVDATGFTAYSSNGGVVARFSDELTGLLAAADAFASSGTISNACNSNIDPISWMDCDINAGTNYGTLSNDTLSGLDTAFNAPWETVAASYDGARPSGKSNLVSALYEGGLEIIYPATADCTTWGVSSNYCGATGTIANLIGAGPSAGTSSYKMSSAYAATAKAQWDQFFAHSHSKYGAKYTDFDGGQWGYGTGDVYQPTFMDYGAFGAYHFP